MAKHRKSFESVVGYWRQDCRNPESDLAMLGVDTVAQSILFQVKETGNSYRIFFRPGSDGIWVPSQVVDVQIDKDVREE